MSVLPDKLLQTRVKADPPLATGVSANDFTSAEAQIQAASLDLTIGDIYLPDTDDDKPGGAYTPLKEHTLRQGHTAVVRTLETLNFGPDIAGIAFPPAHVSLKGLLMTNPGHIDPGYSGHLHLTVINMGRKEFPLIQKTKIVRVIVVGLNGAAQAPFNVRRPTIASPITPELLSRLSTDFLDIEKRATVAAETVIKAAQFRGVIFGLGIPIIVALVGYFAAVRPGDIAIRTDLQKLGERTVAIETKLAQQDLADRIRKIEETIAKIGQQSSVK
jgi:dCTP deaminase